MIPGSFIGDILFWNGIAWVPNAEGVPPTNAVLQWDGATWIPVDPAGLFTQYVVGGAGNLVANGLGTAQAVVLATIAAGDTIIWTRTVNGGAPGVPPLTVITAGVGFSATFDAGDTSTYAWRAIR